MAFNARKGCCVPGQAQARSAKFCKPNSAQATVVVQAAGPLRKKAHGAMRFNANQGAQMEGIRPVGLNALVQILDKETGARRPRGIPRYVCLIVPLLWTLFQLWIISPLPYSLGVGVFNDTATRSIHLSFAIFIAYLYFPMLKSSSRNVIPFTDWVLAAVAAFCASYLFLFQAELVQRPGIPTTLDVVVSYTGILLLLEATRRVMGLPMTVIASSFIV